ncbi:MAG: YdeI/OmpD-associated family protein [Candidatus Amulumruptor caecigallinarius]|nr:YdeI/OmpD-associated family protein [Candidatus Amulumruptor caecigallinarius]MCM1397727.1 YdeI/OmpD-associated family protein [Candidatus Amulumruptor caecigallinarius]MCM1454623.1 YdeI/OmpD-associated family protein [bacterium]
MEIKNLLDAASRQEFRDWLLANASTAAECWLRVKKGRNPVDGLVLYLDAVEEALCFGWIDSTCKLYEGVVVQRFSPRKKDSNWTELNKERCRRLIKIGLMTDSGMEGMPDLDEKFTWYPEVEEAFKKNRIALKNFKSFHPLYQRVRIDKIHNEKNRGREENFQKRLQKLIEASEKGIMIGDWNDYGRLLKY